MARVTHVYSIDYVAKMIGESLELIEVVSGNADNIDYGEMIHVRTGTKEGLITFTDRGIENLLEFLTNARTWPKRTEAAKTANLWNNPGT